MEEAEEIKQLLADRGLTLYSWAIKNGYMPVTVYTAVKRWAGRTDRKPHGGTSKAIMKRLRKEVQQAAKA